MLSDPCGFSSMGPTSEAYTLTAWTGNYGKLSGIYIIFKTKVPHSKPNYAEYKGPTLDFSNNSEKKSI